MHNLTNFTLNKIIDNSLVEFNNEPEKVNFLFHFGLQEFLSLLAGLYISGVSQSKITPPGFTSKYSKTFISPTLGGILNGFLLWIATQDVHPSLGKLSAYLLETEKKGKGWLSPMVQWRNKYEHPKDYSKEEVLNSTIPFLNKIPNFSEFGNIEIKNNNSLIWSSNGYSLAVEPFIYFDGLKIQSFTDINKNGELKFKTDYPDLNNKFGSIWSKLRVNDILLEDPTIEDIKGKILAIPQTIVSQKNPWWAAQIIDDTVFARFIEPGCLNFSRENGKLSNKNILHVPCLADEAKSPFEMICGSIGIAPLKNINELASIIQDLTLLLTIDATKISSKKLLSMLFWLADLNELELTEQIRVLIERDLNSLGNDQEKLWDRLPDELDKLFNKAPGAKNEGLKSYYWHRKTKKTFGIF